MTKGAAEFKSCIQCQEPLNIGESFLSCNDWRHPDLDFLQHHNLPTNCSDAIKIKRKSFTFFVE